MKITQQWVTNISGKLAVAAVDVNEKGDTVAVAGIDNVVACLEADGMIRWKKRVGNQAWRVAISDDGRRIAATTGSSRFWNEDHLGLHYFAGNGTRLWYEPFTYSVWGLAMSGDGRTIAIGTNRPHISLYSHRPQMNRPQLLWEEEIKSWRPFSWSWATALSNDGQQTIFGFGDQRIRLLGHNGQLMDTHQGYANIHTVAMAGNGTRAAAADLKGNVQIYDGKTGARIEKFRVGDEVWSVYVSDEGDRILIATDPNDSHLHMYTGHGEFVWRRHVGGKARYVAADKTAHTIVVGTRSGRIRFFDGEGYQLDEDVEVGARIRSLAVAGNGTLAVAAAVDGNVYGFKLGNPDKTAGEKLMETAGDKFGAQLKYYRNRAVIPPEGKSLTQTEFAEKLGKELGDFGPSYATVSNWERDKHTINQEDRDLLLGIIRTLHKYQGLRTVLEAETLLKAGRYRGLSRAEREKIFGADSVSTSEDDPDVPTTPPFGSEEPADSKKYDVPQLSHRNPRDYGRLLWWLLARQTKIYQHVYTYGRESLSRIGQWLSWLLLAPAIVAVLAVVAISYLNPTLPMGWPMIFSGLVAFFVGMFVLVLGVATELEATAAASGPLMLLSTVNLTLGLTTGDLTGYVMAFSGSAAGFVFAILYKFVGRRALGRTAPLLALVLAGIVLLLPVANVILGGEYQLFSLYGAVFAVMAMYMTSYLLHYIMRRIDPPYDEA